MKKLLIALLASLASLAPAEAQQTPAPPAPGALQKSVEQYVRNLYAFGPDVKLTVGPLKETGIPGLLETVVDLKMGDNADTARMFVSKDGKYLFRGEMTDLTKDPLAENRGKLDLKNAPVLGNPDAPVTLVEFSDFECPVCRQLHNVLRDILPKYPQVKVVFKDFPLEQVHPWARTAALAGRCAYSQDPKAFWKMYDLIYDGQEVISATNAWAKVLDFAGQSGLNGDAFKACMAGPDAAAAIDASRDNAIKAEVNSTPTVFVNGRRLVGADQRTLEQYIQYELQQLKSNKTAAAQ